MIVSYSASFSTNVNIVSVAGINVNSIDDFKNDLTTINTKLDQNQLVLDNILDSARGGWYVENNQMIFLKWNGTELFRFDLKDENGVPNANNVRQMVAVK